MKLTDVSFTFPIYIFLWKTLQFGSWKRKCVWSTRIMHVVVTLPGDLWSSYYAVAGRMYPRLRPVCDEYVERLLKTTYESPFFSTSCSSLVLNGIRSIIESPGRVLVTSSVTSERGRTTISFAILIGLRLVPFALADLSISSPGLLQRPCKEKL